MRRAQETFVPERSVFQKGYVDKAATESSLLSVFEKQRADLSTIPTLDGRTLADTVQGFLKASNQIQVLLSSRAQAPKHLRAASPNLYAPARFHRSTAFVMPTSTSYALTSLPSRPLRACGASFIFIADQPRQARCLTRTFRKDLIASRCTL